MNIKKSIVAFLSLTISVLHIGDCWGQSMDSSVKIAFRSGSNILYQHYLTNNDELKVLDDIVSDYEDVILTGNGHLQIVANIPAYDAENLFLINRGATRAVVIANYLRGKYRFMTRWNFSFYVHRTDSGFNTLTVTYLPSPLAVDAPKNIYYSEDTGNIAAIRSAINKYGGIPYLKEAVIMPDEPELGKETDEKATSPVEKKPVDGNGDSEDVLIAIYYRWDKDNLDSLYLSNPAHLAKLDSILTSSNAQYIDTLTIVAFASPEGHPDYNKALSQRRANTIRDYIIDRYENIPSERIVVQARGENWEGVL